MNRKIQSALISVFYKDGLEPIVKLLSELGVRIYSTGGTQSFIEKLGVLVTPVESLTSHPSILGGRVKTLHPSVFGGILGKRDDETHRAEMKQYQIPEIDLVIVSTPPDTHAMWALRALEAGKSVVMEKPMALSTADCDAVLDIARTVGRTALVYQNRRWDSDYLTLQQAVHHGRLGTLFHLETFVGGYGHPCNYWHSDALVSGGAIFDWGSHFIDQVLQLVPAPVRSVTGVNHKRQWLDVTNADHSVVDIAFEDGTHAQFIHSDLAAALKPKYYALGTEGAIVGNWRQERLISRTGIGTMAEEVFAPADSPADLTLIAGNGDRTLLAPVSPRPHGFHRELADQLLAGLPLSVRPEESRQVVAVMEAAETSAARGSVPITPL